ncbi:sigma-70 family RNA polymerase sigma factor, partial [Candidatus Fermentibacteria bacterium]|nr:sigma-70 family RNA polymerase sigma factor [Candidatus Fermentibacteria bacterium]
DVRRKAREEASGIEALLNGAPDVDDLIDDAMVVRAVAEAIDALPEPQRLAIVATVLEGRTFRELAVETGDPMGTLMARKKRGMDAVRHRLRERGIIQS